MKTHDQNTGSPPSLKKRTDFGEIEHLAESIFSTASDGIVVVDMAGRFVEANGAFLELVGYSYDELLDLHFGDLTPPGWHETHQKAFDRVMAEGSINDFEKEYRHKDGHIIPVALTASLIKDESGRPCYMTTIVRDITERRRSEAELNAVREQYELAVRGSNDGIWDWDLRTNDLYVSPQWKAIIGYADNELPNEFSSFQNNVHPDDRNRVFQYVDDYLSGKIEDYNIEFRFRHKDGSYRWILARGEALRDENGKPYRMAGSHTDITERKIAEERLRSSEELLKAAGSLARMGGWEIDLKTMDVLWTDAMFDLFELPKGRIPELDDAISYYAPEARPLIRRAVEQGMSHAKSWDMKLPFVSARGREMWVRSVGNVIVEKGRPVKLYGVFQDITKERESEEKIRRSLETTQQILEAMPYGVVIVGRDRIVRMANAAALSIMGVPQEHIVGKQCHNNLCTTPYGRCPILDLCKDDDRSEREIINGHGEKIPVLKTVLPIVIDGEDVLLEAFVDISDLKRVEAELRKARDLAESANRSKSEFLANMSHEIRTPMNAIMGFSEMLQASLTDPEHRSCLESIMLSAETLLKLIDDILDLSKIEAGKLSIDYENVDPYRMFSEIERMFSLRIAEKDLDFIVDVDPDLPGALVLDDVRLRQVLVNLVGNALKFTHEGYIKLSARRMIKDAEESRLDLVISVEDTGTGIKPEALESIFEAFRQQDGQSSRKYGGTGLGLSISRRLTEMMNGALSVKSEVGKGSIFEVILRDVSVAGTVPEPMNTTGLSVSDVAFESALVLIADDIESNRDLLCKWLKKLNMEVIEAENGQEAIDLVNARQPDLVFMDIRMPVMDGIAALKKLKSDPATSSIPVVALTASVTSLDKGERDDAGFDRFLFKPIHLKDVIDVLCEYLEHERSDSLEEPLVDGDEQQIADIVNASDLARSLKETFVPRYDEIVDVMVGEEIEEFASDLKKLALAHSASALTKYADRLLSAAQAFDVDKIEQLMKRFGGVLDEMNLSDL